MFLITLFCTFFAHAWSDELPSPKIPEIFKKHLLCTNEERSVLRFDPLDQEEHPRGKISFYYQEPYSAIVGLDNFTQDGDFIRLEWSYVDEFQYTITYRLRFNPQTTEAKLERTHRDECSSGTMIYPPLKCATITANSNALSQEK